MAAMPKRSAQAQTAAAPASAQAWEVIFHDDFLPEFRAFDLDVRRELVAAARAIELAGPKAGRPHVDTLKGSKHDHMKELRSADRRFDAHLANTPKERKKSP